MQATKYLYISKSTQYGKINTRMTSTKASCKKNEICIKLNINIDADIFSDSVPSVTLDVPKDFRQNLNLRID